MSNNNNNQDDQIIKLGNGDDIRDLFDKAFNILNEIDMLKSDLKELVADVSKKTGVKAPLLNKSIRSARKADLDKTQQEVETMAEIIKKAGP